MENKITYRNTGGLQESSYTKLLNLRDLFLSSPYLQKNNINKNTIDLYRTELTQFMQWILQEQITEFTQESIIAYREYLKSKNLSFFTVSNYLVPVRKFFEWAEGMKYFPNIAKGISTGAKRPRGFMKDILIPSQIMDILEAIDTSTLTGKRDFAIINLLVRTALRTIEIIRADVGDIRQKESSLVLYIQGKGREVKDDFVKLTPAALQPIQEYLQARGSSRSSEPLFTSDSCRNKGQRLTTRTIRGIVKNYLRAVNIDNTRITAHSLRHTGITLALKGGSTLQEAQKLARHTNINTTLIYSHNIERLTNAPEDKIDSMLKAI